MSLPPVISSAYLGPISWDPQSEIIFPAGLPGFEEERRMLPVEVPAHRPLVYLQSLERGEVCFLALPVFTIDPDFELRVSDDERLALQLGPETEDQLPRIGVDLLCLALLVPSGHTVEANLNAPLVINLRNLRGIQSVASGACPRIMRLSGDGRWEPAC